MLMIQFTMKKAKNSTLIKQLLYLIRKIFSFFYIFDFLGVVVSCPKAILGYSQFLTIFFYKLNVVSHVEHTASEKN